MLGILPYIVNIISDSVGCLFSSLMESFHEQKFLILSLVYQLLSFIVITFVSCLRKLCLPRVMKIFLFFWKLYCLGLHILDQDISWVSFYVWCEVEVIILPVVPAWFADVIIFSLLDCSAAFTPNPVSIGVLLEDSPFCSTGPCVCLWANTTLS